MPLLSSWGLGMGDSDLHLDFSPCLEGVIVDASIMSRSQESLDTPPTSSFPLCMLSPDEEDHSCPETHHLRRAVETNPTFQPHVLPKRTWVDVLKLRLLIKILRKGHNYALFTLPSFYSTRFTIFFEAGFMPLDNLKMAIFEHAINPISSKTQTARKARKPLFSLWVMLLDSLIKGWETMNIISALLLTAIFSVIQLDNSAAQPDIHFSALASMFCALLSLMFGCLCIIWLGTMKELHKAANIRDEVRKQHTHFSSTWVMLAMPAVWLGWSIFWFTICTMSLLWRTGAAEDKYRQPSTGRPILVPRVLVAVLLALGLIHLVFARITMKWYGLSMDRRWNHRIGHWVIDLRETLRHKIDNTTNEAEKASLQKGVSFLVSRFDALKIQECEKVGCEVANINDQSAGNEHKVSS
ncbi:hypothetical protein BJ165DRAFT_1389965 [Panaeolus papilionaceus]|nr:hypothetical protein BJ165DRAFT_1389965 [Panaeolus papilionaceus]